MASLIRKRDVQIAVSRGLAAELTLALLAGMILFAGRWGLQSVAASFDRRVLAIALLGVITATAALVAARRSDDDWRFWTLIALAAFAWAPGRALPHGAQRGALLAVNGGFLVSVAVFAIALSLAVHTSTNFADRQKLALDLIPQMIGLIVIAWLGWIGPRALNDADGRWFGMVAAGHGLVDVLLVGLCAAGAVGRRQGVAGKPSSFMLAGVGLLATGDALALPVWERSDAVLIAGSQAMVALGFLLIAYTAIRAWRPRIEPPREPTVAASWTGQLPNLILIGLLLVAIAQALSGQRVRGGVATAIAAGIVIIIFGMARQSLTTRAERRLRQEIDQLSAQIDGLVSQVGRDPLTGLLNHRAIHERLEQEIERARADGASLAVALVDVDNFKIINDRRGHQAGDRVLRAISSILIASCRGADVAARYAGDEFMLIFPGLDEAHAATVCERIVTEVRRINRYLNLGQDLDVTLSVGVAVGHRWSEGALKIIGVADAAMYDAKESGKDQAVVVNADTMVAIASARRDAAIASGGLPLLQPRAKDRRYGRFERAS
jgi:diguanylate cyclase (GGDEF)-like protein